MDVRALLRAVRTIIVQSPGFAAGAIPGIDFSQTKSHSMKLPTILKRTLPVLALTASCAIVGQASAADAPPVANVQAAREKISMCIGCHGIKGYKASFPEVYHVPMIAGQNAKYIEAALNEYRKGSRSHPTMDAIAGSLTDQDIVDLAAYYANLK